MIIDLTTINYKKNISPKTCIEIKTSSEYISYGNTKELIQLKNEIRSNGFFVTHTRYAILTNFRILIYADKETFLKKKKPKNDFNIFEYDFEVDGKAFKIIKNNITVKIYYFSSISIAILWWESIKQIRIGEKIEFDNDGNQIISYDKINNNLTKKITIIENNENIKNITEINNHILSRNKNKNTYLRKNNSDININNNNLTEKNSFYNNNQNNTIHTHNIINEKITTHNIINEYNISTKKIKNYDLNKTCILNEDEGNYKLNNIRKSILNDNLDDIKQPLYSHKTYRGIYKNSKSISPSIIYKTKTNKRVHIEEGNNKNYYFDNINGNINEIHNKNKGKEINSPEFKKIDETIIKENTSFISNNSGFLYITHDTPNNNNERNNVENLKTKINQYEINNINSLYKKETINKRNINNKRNKNNNFYENEENDNNIKNEEFDNNSISNEDSDYPIIIKTKPTYLKNILENENNSLKSINNSNKIKKHNNNNNDSNIKENTSNNYQKIPQIQSTLMNIVKTSKTTKKKYIDNIKSNLNPNMVTTIVDNINSNEEKNNLISENNTDDSNLNNNQVSEHNINNNSKVFNNKIYKEDNSNISEYCNNGDNSEINYNENSNLLDNIIKINKTTSNNYNEETDEENTIYNNYDSSEVSNEEEKYKKNTKRQNIILNSSLKNIINPDNESEISDSIPQNINIITLSNSDYGINSLKNNINGSNNNLYNENTEKSKNEKSNIENSHSMIYIDNINSYTNNNNNNVTNSNISQLYNSKIISSDNINFDLSDNNNSIIPSNNTKKVVSSDKTLNVSSNNNNNNILSDNIFSVSSESQIINSKKNQIKNDNENLNYKPSNFDNSNIYIQNHNESKIMNYDEIYNNSNLCSNNNQSKISNYEDNKINNSNYNEETNNSNLYIFTKSNNSNLENFNKNINSNLYNFNKSNERIYDNNSTIETNFNDINKKVNNKKELNFNQHKLNNYNEDKQINLNTNNPYSKINISLISNSSRLNNYSDIYNKKTRKKKESKIIMIDNENEIPILNNNSKRNKFEYKNKLNTDYINMNYSKINIIDKIQNNGNDNFYNFQNSKKTENNITTNDTENYSLETKNIININKNKNVNLNNSKINYHQRSKSSFPSHQKSLVFLENEYIFKDEKYNYVNEKKQPSQLIEELLENRYSLEMLLFSVKEKTKNSTFISKLDYNLKIILNCRSFNLIILNSLFKKFPLIYKNRLLKEDIKDHIFDFVNNNLLIHKKIRNLILNDILAIKELINSYYEEIHYSMKSNVFIENFNNFNSEMNNILELIKI